MIKFIRTAFEEEIRNCDTEQLGSLLEKNQSFLNGKSTTQSDENTKLQEKNAEESRRLQSQYENLLGEQKALKDKFTAIQSKAETVESTMSKSLKQDRETDLVDETIRAKMKPLLKNDQVADEDLIEGMSSAMAAESERATKFNFTGRGKPAPKVATIGTGSTRKPADPLTTYERKIQATLKAIKTELYTVQSEVATLRTKLDHKDSKNKEHSSPRVLNQRDDHYKGRCPPIVQKKIKLTSPISIDVEEQTTLLDFARRETIAREGCPRGTNSSLNRP